MNGSSWHWAVSFTKFHAEPQTLALWASFSTFSSILRFWFPVYMNE